ncbi:MAG: flavodoxin family protein [Christensenellales bacterium]|jgi:multimeric flavodoxin WrbA
MKVVAVYGSPRPQGNSNTLLREAVRGAREAGHEVVAYVLNEMNVKGCQGCRVCREKGCFCVVPDDLAPYWDQVQQAGALMVSAPNYCSLICGPALTYMNRHYCILNDDMTSRWTPGKKLVGIFSQGRPDPEGYRQVYEHFMGDFEFRTMQRHALIVHAGKTPASQMPELMAQAYRAGHTL